MSRKSNVSQQANEEETTATAAESMDGSAVGIVRTPTGYTVVKLDFNYSSGNAKVVRSHDVGSSKLEAAERFKILAAEEGLV